MTFSVLSRLLFYFACGCYAASFFSALRKNSGGTVTLLLVGFVSHTISQVTRAWSLGNFIPHLMFFEIFFLPWMLGLFALGLSFLRKDRRLLAYSLIPILFISSLALLYPSGVVPPSPKVETFLVSLFFGNPRYDDFYAQAQVTVGGEKLGTGRTVKGKSCLYGITIFRDAPNRNAAEDFLDFLLHPDGGMRIFQESGQSPLTPCEVATEQMKASLPANLRKWVTIHP